MRYTVISDIHGNLEALEAVINEAYKLNADNFVCLGDIVGYGPQPAECIKLLQKHSSTIIAGNHDYAVANKIDISNFNVLAREATLWTRESLDEAALDFLADLPLAVHGDGFTAVHGTLQSPELFDYIQTSYDAFLSMQKMERPLCFIGHSHVPIAFIQNDLISYTLEREIRIEADAKTIVNVGSVGQPRDYDPRSSFAIYDSEKSVVELHRARYDVDSVTAKIERFGLPRPLGERLVVGR